MAATVAADFAFAPKVWADHINAFFLTKLAFGAFAFRDNTLTQAPGETVNFPFFEAIGAAEEPAEADDLVVDNLTDSSFSATVKEVGKAVGFTDKSLRVSAAKKDVIYEEAQSQIGRVMAEKVDSDIITELNTGANHTVGFLGAAADSTGFCTVKNILKGKITAFGDRQEEAEVIFMHSYLYLMMMTDSDAGFLKADATHPMFGVPGYMGLLFGMAVVVNDKCPAGPTIATKKSYMSFICKPKAFGILTAEELQFEKDRDILARKTFVTATQWYAVKGFHGKIAATDKRVARLNFVTDITA